MRLKNILGVAAIATAIFSFSKNEDLVVTSTAFKSNGNMPLKYSCEGKGINPPLSIGYVPSDARSIAIIMHDPDAPKAGGFTHWVVWNIQPTKIEIPEDYKDAVQGLNGAGEAGYKGMCPPSGIHHYHFMVYALDTQLDLDKKTDKTGLEKAMEGHVLAKGELIGLYKKTK